jgi:hypothetical protein
MTRFRRLPFNLAEPVAPVSAPTGFVEQLNHRLSVGALLHQRLQYAAVNLRGETLCWLDMCNGRVLVAEPSEQMTVRLQLALSERSSGLSLSPLDPDAFERQAQYTRAAPLRPTLWQAGLSACTANAPLPPLTARSSLQLRRWPDFRVLAHRHGDFRICALLIKRAMDVEACSLALTLPRAEVQSFFNAAYLSGYAYLVQTQTQPVLRQSNGRGLVQLWRDVRARWSA